MSCLLSFCVGSTKAASSVSGYVCTYTISTNNVSGWSSIESTSIYADVIERNGKSVVSFSSEDDSVLEASFLINSLTDVEFDVSSLTFKFLLYIDNISTIKDRNGNILGGKVGFYGSPLSVSSLHDENEILEEEAYYEWDLSDLNLKQGWNRLTLNFKTANTDSAKKINSFEEINEFRFTIKKNPGKVLVTALDNAEVCVLDISDSGKTVLPITDSYSVKEFVIAAGVAAFVVAGFALGCYIKEKKAEKKRLNERRAKALARKRNTENSKK